ncbi:MAG: hypothetical protein A2Z08_10690 [Deltaproteobacteria bacterium RBG_16_54_11]|nr:MAG: hypothetical protein A2Z08_10690 [Deltaproteobacteria bacterium RBG_16_54_11]
MWTDILSSQEAEYTKTAIEELKEIEWAKPLLSKIQKNGGLCSETMPLLFEVRFAYELYKANITAEYEYSANIGNSTIEFKLNTLPQWLIELVSIRESGPLKNATTEISTWYGRFSHRELSTNANDPLQSEEAEMIRVAGKIGEKVLLNGQPTKFPQPNNTYHLILVDMRGYLGSGGDRHDYEHIACGYDAQNNPFPPHCWNGEIIKGIFDSSNTKLKAAHILRERIHFIGFITEKNYTEGEIKNNTFYAVNCNLITNKETLNKIWATYPLKSETMKAY